MFGVSSIDMFCIVADDTPLARERHAEILYAIRVRVLYQGASEPKVEDKTP